MTKRKNNNPLDHVSEAELSAMTDTLDQMHHDMAMPAMRDAVTDWVASFKDATAGVSRRASSRRTFLLGTAGVGAGGVLLAACGSSSKSAAPTTAAAATTTTAAAATPTTAAGSSTTAGGALTGDLQVAGTAASLENLAVFAYNAGLQAATAGKLGKVPPAVAVFATTAKAQHTDHANGWNAALTGAGKTAVTASDPVVTPIVQAAFAKVTDVTGLAELALLLENTAAQTYQAAIPALAAKSSIQVAATIQPVEMQHAAILYYVLGRYPGIQGTASSRFAMGTPLSTNPIDLARPATDYTGT